MISYRKLLPQERGELLAHLHRLSPQDRAFRFFGAISDASVARYVEGLDWGHAIVMGAFQHGHLRGSVELMYHRTKKGDGMGELAVSVESEYQGRGIGTQLVRDALLSAQNLAITDVEVLTMPDNTAMRRIAGRFGPGMRIANGEATASLRIAAPSQATIWREQTREFFGWMSDIADRWRFA